MKSYLKNMASKTLDAIRLPNLTLFLKRKKPCIFLYHGVSPEMRDFGIFNYRQKFISPDSFDEQIQWLKKKFTILPLLYLLELWGQQKGFPEPTCAITFDDGYRNNFEHAFPILQNLRVPATFFLTTDFVDEKNPLWVDLLEYAIGLTTSSALFLGRKGLPLRLDTNSRPKKCRTDDILRNYLKRIPEDDKNRLLESIIGLAGNDLRSNISSSPYRAMTWDQIRTMQEAKLFDFAAHTKSHPVLSKLPDRLAENEIIESKQRIVEETGSFVPIFAYPNGREDDFSEKHVSTLKRNGFKAALTTIPGRITEKSDLFSLPRIALDGTVRSHHFRVKASGLHETLHNLS